MTTFACQNSDTETHTHALLCLPWRLCCCCSNAAYSGLLVLYRMATWTAEHEMYIPQKPQFGDWQTSHPCCCPCLAKCSFDPWQGLNYSMPTPCFWGIWCAWGSYNVVSANKTAAVIVFRGGCQLPKEYIYLTIPYPRKGIKWQAFPILKFMMKRPIEFPDILKSSKERENWEGVN